MPRLRIMFLTHLVQNFLRLWPLWLTLLLYILLISLFQPSPYTQGLMATSAAILGIEVNLSDPGQLPGLVDLLNHLVGLFIIGVMVWIVTESIRGNIH